LANVRLFVLFRTAFNARFYYPIFTILFLDFGLTLSQFAMLNAVWAGTIVLMEVPSGALADVMGRRNLLVFTGWVMVIEIALICLAPRSNTDVLFLCFLVNRVLSGVAEAAASGADEALAYDTLKANGMAHLWGRVLEVQMRVRSLAVIVAMSLGAAVYDPDLVQGVLSALGTEITVSKAVTLRLPLWLTLVMALVTLAAALKMREPDSGSTGSTATCQRPGIAGCKSAVFGALGMTLSAGRWILNTPFALVLIGAGLLFDGILRVVLTLTSQYYRLIDLPEAAFGLIGSALGLLGLVVPRLARAMAENRTPRFNLAVLAAMTVIGLAGLVPVWPVYGVLPVVLLAAVMYLINHFMSHYLNRITDSSRRATVLSFKGLAFNLSYGLAGIGYTLMLERLRSHDPGRLAAGMSPGAVEDQIFVASLATFPWIFMAALTVLVASAAWHLRRSDEHRQIG
jgi:MFS family permease